MFNRVEHPHRRFNPLTGNWVLVSPHRNKRPWQGAIEKTAAIKQLAHDPDCYLCSGNTRINGEINPEYHSTFVFKNDFAALNMDLVEQASQLQSESLPFIQEMPAAGACRVICFSPKHNLSLPELSIPELCDVVVMWIEQYSELVVDYEWVQIFENKGSVMGCSNPHPHGQIWASFHTPSIPAESSRRQAEYFEKHDSVLLMDYVKFELETQQRIVDENEHWVTVVPFWAAWPFEIMMLPKRHVSNMSQLTIEEKYSLASLLKQSLTRYDNLFEISFPYSMGWFQSMQRGSQDMSHTLFAHFSPPLLRSASVKKFMVGYEMYGETQRDITPEQAAEALRSVSNSNHYRLKEL